MSCFFRYFSFIPVEAAVILKNFIIDVPIVPVYFSSLPRILSAAVLPCLFAGPAKGTNAFCPVIAFLISITSPAA